MHFMSLKVQETKRSSGAAGHSVDCSEQVGDMKLAITAKFRTSAV